MKFARNYWGNGFYEVAFPLLHTNHLHGKRGPHNLHVLQPKKNRILHETTEAIGFYEVTFPLLHTNHLLGKRGPHNLHGLQPKKIEICTKPLRQLVLCGRISIITHKSLYIMGWYIMDYGLFQMETDNPTTCSWFYCQHYKVPTSIRNVDTGS